MKESVACNPGLPKWTCRKIQTLALPGSFYPRVQARPELGLVGFLHGRDELSIHRFENGRLALAGTWHCSEEPASSFLTIRADPLGIAIAAKNRFSFVHRESTTSVAFPEILAKAVFFPTTSQSPVVCHQQARGGSVYVSWLNIQKQTFIGTKTLFDFDIEAGYEVFQHPYDPILGIHATLPQHASLIAFVRVEGNGSIEVLNQRIDPPLEASHMAGFSRDGRHVMVVGDSEAIVYNWSNGARIGAVFGNPKIYSDFTVGCVGGWVGNDLAFGVWDSVHKPSTEVQADVNRLMVFDLNVQLRLAETFGQYETGLNRDARQTELSRQELCGLVGLSDDMLLAYVPDGAILFRIERDQTPNASNTDQSQNPPSAGGSA